MHQHRPAFHVPPLVPIGRIERAGRQRTEDHQRHEHRIRTGRKYTADMARNSSDASRRYHDRVARQYDAIYDDPYWAFHDELTWRAVKPHLPRDAAAQCLDLGCGTGKWGLQAPQDRVRDHLRRQRRRHGRAGPPQDRGDGRPRRRRPRCSSPTSSTCSALPARHVRADAGHGRPAVDLLRPASRRPRDAPRQQGRAASSSPPPTTSSPPSIITSSAATSTRWKSSSAPASTNWLTAEERERFELTTFTPLSLRKLFEKRRFRGPGPDRQDDPPRPPEQAPARAARTRSSGC